MPTEVTGTIITPDTNPLCRDALDRLAARTGQPAVSAWVAALEAVYDQHTELPEED